jgi:hypothetical protein
VAKRLKAQLAWAFLWAFLFWFAPVELRANVPFATIA